MPDATARPHDDPSTGRVLDAQTSFGRPRDDWQAFNGLQGHAVGMQSLFRAVERLAPHARATLITGETGVGKSTLAGVVYRLGPCHGGAQITLVGGDEPLERDCLREAARGTRAPVTCFVPEVRDLTHDEQTTLVRAMTASSDLPPGEGLHVIACTSTECSALLAHGDVRGDLLYRLGAVRFHLPSLDARRDDIGALATTLLRDACRRLCLGDKTWSGASLSLLAGRRWPGNVRELKNVILRAAALSDEPVIGAHTVREASGPELELRDETRRGAGRRTDTEAERRRVMATLAAAGGNKSAAAAKLGVSRRSFYRMLDRLGA